MVDDSQTAVRMRSTIPPLRQVFNGTHTSSYSEPSKQVTFLRNLITLHFRFYKVSVIVVENLLQGIGNCLFRFLVYLMTSSRLYTMLNI
jgi:hypothetical protein